MLSDQISEFTASLEASDIPAPVRDKAKLHLLDTIGVMLAASRFREVRPVLNLATEMGGEPECTVVGSSKKVGLPNAVFANGTVTHSIDFDDTHLGSGIHMSATVVPTALAVGEKVDSSGSELLTAIVAGYEVAARLGLAAPWKFQDRGFHPTSVVGVFSATVVASKLLGLTQKEMVGAMGLAGSMASGILESLNDGTWVKPIHAGWASHAGVIAALMAKRGYAGPAKVLEGNWGVYNTYLRGEEVSLQGVTAGLGRDWETLNIVPKPYPACHVTHSAIDAAITLRKTYDISITDIQEVVCQVPKITQELVCEPVEEKIRPSTPYGAKFSIYYTTAVALTRGYVGVWDFADDKISDSRTLDVSTKVRYILNKDYEGHRGSEFVPVTMSLKSRDSEHTVEVIHHKGTPQNPMKRDDILTKFYDNLERTPQKSTAASIADSLLNMEQHSARKLAQTLAPVTASILASE